MSVAVLIARENLIQIVLRRVHAHYADELEYCDDMILQAAKELVAADAATTDE